MTTILNNPAANDVLAKFAASGNETCFHGRHIEPQIYKDLNGKNWTSKITKPVVATRPCVRSWAKMAARA